MPDPTQEATPLGFTRVSKAYGAENVLTDISLSLSLNATTAIVGESGSGKSTLLQIANGLVVPDQGQVLLGGLPIDYTKLAEIRRQMGYSIQGAGLFPHLSVFENVTLVARLSGWDEDRLAERYQEVLSFFELSNELSGRFPHSLSGGQAQRVGLCRAIMMDPTLLLLDEPFSALDPLTRSAIHEQLLKARKETAARTILLVTHDMNEARKLADTVVILREGRILQVGPPDQIAAAPADDYVERLFGSEAHQ